MVDLEPRLRRLKEIFPAGERPILMEAAKNPTFELAVRYLTNIYGAPATKPSAWATPPNISQTQSTPRSQAVARAVGNSAPPADIFTVENYKTKPCANKAGCACDKYHHEFERRRDPSRYQYSEIPCQHVFIEGQWRAPGLCKVGDKCTFAHSVNEASFHPRCYKTRNCNHYENGNCYFGSKCAYIHGRDDPVAAAWRRRVEQRSISSQQSDRPIDRGVSLSNFIPKNLVPEEQKSTLRASAWEFTPVGKSPLEIMNAKLQSRVEELYLKTLCTICFHSEKNCALVPCGHLFCKTCMQQTMRAQCPICRKDITDRLEVFF